METKIRSKNIKLYGWHGFAETEKKRGQQFEIDIEVSTSLASAINTLDIYKQLITTIYRIKW